MTLSRRRTAALIAPTLLVAIAACGGDGGDADAGGSIHVFAAASLTGPFAEIEAAFEAAHPGVDVVISPGASSALRDQIINDDAPADVFASASLAIMQTLVEHGAAVADDPVTFVENQLEIAVPVGNPGGVTSLADFADETLLIGLCAAEVPCGQYGREALANAGVAPSIDTNAANVTELLTQIGSDDLDAGIVYRSDVLARGEDVEGIEIPDDQNVLAPYPIAALVDAANPSGAADFIAFVLSPEGQAILAAHGFERP